MALLLTSFKVGKLFKVTIFFIGNSKGNNKKQVSFFKENTIQVCTLLHAYPYRNDFHQAQLFKESLIVTNMTLSFKWKEKHFSQRHHTTFVDKKNAS